MKKFEGKNREDFGPKFDEMDLSQFESVYDTVKSSNM
jgi:hypothetical protein